MSVKPEIKDIIQWDVKSWSKALQFWEREVKWENVHNCLEIGGREGGLSLWLALKGKKVICSDIYFAKDKAENLHKRYGINNLVQYEDIDATKIPYENFFDLIVFKSVLGSIGQSNNPKMQEEAINQMYKALKPGGVLLFAENLIGSPFHQYARQKFNKWGGWLYVSEKKLNKLLSPFSSVLIKTTGVIAVFGRSESQKNFLAGLDKTLLNSIFPRKWHYIAFGIAKK